MVGLSVRVWVRNGEAFEGVLRCVSPDIDVVLEFVHKVTELFGSNTWLFDMRSCLAFVFRSAYSRILLASLLMYLSLHLYHRVSFAAASLAVDSHFKIIIQIRNTPRLFDSF